MNSFVRFFIVKNVYVIIILDLLALYLYGFTKNAIVYDTTRKNWVIIDDINKPNDYEIVGIYTPAKSTSSIPKGTGPWRLFDKNCKYLTRAGLSLEAQYPMLMHIVE